MSRQDPGAADVATGRTPYELGRCTCSCLESLHKPDEAGVRGVCSNSNCTCRRYTEEKPMQDRYMMATAATHHVGDLTRETPSLAVIYGEDGDDWIGEWVAGIGFINVRFPKATTRDLTDAEKAHYGSRFIETAGRVRPIQIDDPNGDAS